MKKLILVAGLAGIIVTGAFAQQSGNRTSAETVSVSVDTYMNISALSKGFTFQVTDGGFASTYASDGAASFTAVSNVAYTLDASVSIATFTVLSKLNGGAFSATASSNHAITPGQAHSVDVQLQGNTSTGLAPNAGTNGTLTVNITAQ